MNLEGTFLFVRHNSVVVKASDVQFRGTGFEYRLGRFILFHVTPLSHFNIYSRISDISIYLKISFNKLKIFLILFLISQNDSEIYLILVRISHISN